MGVCIAGAQGIPLVVFAGGVLGLGTFKVYSAVGPNLENPWFTGEQPMKRYWAVILLAIAGGGVSLDGMAANVEGRITFTAYDDKYSAPEPADTVVFFKPDALVEVKPLKGDITKIGRASWGARV